MKPKSIPQYVVFIMVIILNTNCGKEPPSFNTDNSPSLAKSNTAPNCNAGRDIRLLFRTNFCTLNGTAVDLENNIQTYSWNNVSGPSSFLIEHPDSLSTKVSNLQIGVYQFELIVTDSMGMYGKDTIKVTVTDRNEIIFENQTWIYPWYNAIEVKYFDGMTPPGTVFRIYISRDTNPAWIEAHPVTYNGAGGPYEYFIETRPDGGGMYTYGSLYIFYYGMETSDTPDVKIVY